jgi:hypothetical protein
MKESLEKLQETPIRDRRLILYRMMYETSKKNLCSNLALRAPYMLHQKRYYNIQKQLLVSKNMVSSLLELPVELVYRILDNLGDETIFLSLSNAHG